MASVATIDAIPLQWQTDLETIDTVCGGIWCCGKFLCFVGCFFGYFLIPMLLISVSLYFFLGIFFSIGIACLVMESLQPERDEQLKAEYQHAMMDHNNAYEYNTNSNILKGCIVDRCSERRCADPDNVTDRPSSGVARVWTAYFVKVQYQVQVPPNYHLDNNVVLDSLRQELVVQKAFSVTREVYYGCNDVKVVVLPGLPKSGHLLDRVQDKGGSTRSCQQICIGVGLIIVSIALGVIPFLTDDGFTVVDGVALLLHGIILLGILVWVNRRSLQDIQDIKSGKGNCAVIAIVPKGTHYDEKSSEKDPPPIDGSHDYCDGYTVNGFTTYPDRGAPGTQPSMQVWYNA